MDVIPPNTRKFSEIVSQTYALAFHQNAEAEWLGLMTRCFDCNKSVILRIPEDSKHAEIIASCHASDEEIFDYVSWWRSLPEIIGKNCSIESEGAHLLRRMPTGPTHRFSDFLQRLAHSSKETCLVGIIEKSQQSTRLVWLHRDSESPNFVSHDLEFLKMILSHLRQANAFETRIGALKEHVRANGGVG